MSLFTLITNFLFGNKYYANIINTRGTGKCELSCFIFHTRQEAKEHERGLAMNRSYMFIETISFRSRKDY